MVGLLRKIGLAMVIFILASLGMCVAETKLVTADPAVPPALAQAKVDAQPLLAALDAYHLAKGYYPASLSELTASDPSPQKFRYETLGLNRVYRSLACAGKANATNGWHPQPMTAYKAQQDTIRGECVAGYSAFELKSPRIATKWGINASTEVFAKFASQTAAWSVGWCTRGDRGTSNGDCGVGAE
jgi:hypothetical protein